MTEVLLASCSGGIVNQALIEDLRGDKVVGDAKLLAEIAEFTDLGGTAPKRAEYDADFETAFQVGKAIWAGMADELAVGIDTGRLRDRLLLPLLRHLGFDPQFQRAHLPAAGDTYRVSHLGWDAADAPPFIIEPGEPDVGTGGRRAAHDEMQRYLNGSAVAWGIVTNGTVLRLLRNFHHTRTKGYVQFDLAAIFTAGSVDDFRAMWRTCHASRFQSRADPDTGNPAPASHPHAHCLLEQLHQKSLTAGVTAGNRLKPQIRRAIEELANGALHQNPELLRRLNDEAEFGRALYGELLTVLYRVLFLLFAEQRDMLHSANSLYDETYSLTRLRQQAEERRYEGRRHDLWEGLKATFAAFHDPTLAQALGVYPYNGELFDFARTPHLNAARIPNRNVAAAVRSLTTVEVGKVSLHVDYRHLGVEELGAVYESLLDYTLRVADQPVAAEGRSIAVGQAYLSPFSTERGDLASYYTPPALVSLVLDRSLDPLIADRLSAAGTDPSVREAALLNLRIIDPACGSAAFLVGAVDRVGLAVARERHRPVEPSDAQVASARRDVLSHCIYGADKDPFAVELAKVALWIHCAIADTPLSFLDHHIVCGDSLVGWPLGEPPAEIPRAAFGVPEDKLDSDTVKIVRAAKAANNEYHDGVQQLFGQGAAPKPDLGGITLPTLLNASEATLAEVQAKGEALAHYRLSDAFVEAEQLADLWTTAFFWSATSGPAPTTADYHRAIGGQPNVGLVEQAQAIAAELNPLHWSLAFPDIRERGGFDLVIGNPPWEQFKGEGLEFFKDAAPEIADLTSEHRDEAIRALALTDPGLHARWLRYKAVQDRLAWWSKASSRFTRTANEPNTYILFTEMAAELAGERGSVGLVVKTGIATDEGPAAIWKRLVENGRVREVRDIVNSGPGGQVVFLDVAAVERFCVLVLGPPRSGDTSFEASMLNRGVDAAADTPTRTWDMDGLTLVCPVTRTLPSPSSDEELDVLLSLHRRNQTLDFSEPTGSNPWGIKYHNLFHSSGVKKAGLLHRREDLEADGWTIQPDRTMRHTAGRTALPVYEGQMANLWDHRARTFEGFAGKNKYGRKPHLPWVTEEQHADPTFEVEPRYWMLAQDALKRLAATVRNDAVIAFRDVGAVWTNRRSMKACLFPYYPCTDKLPLFSVKPGFVFGLLAVLNSLTFDFAARSHLTGGWLKAWLVSQCPAPAPSEVGSTARRIARRLSVSSHSVAEAYGLELEAWNAGKRALAMADLDVLVARAYGISSRDEYLVVVDHFHQLHRMETKELGEPRTRRLCLEAWDQAATEGAV
jgi:hypothetical protein